MSHRTPRQPIRKSAISHRLHRKPILKSAISHRLHGQPILKCKFSHRLHRQPDPMTFFWLGIQQLSGSDTVSDSLVQISELIQYQEYQVANISSQDLFEGMVIVMVNSLIHVVIDIVIPIATNAVSLYRMTVIVQSYLL